MKELSIEEKAYDGNYKTYTELINRLENVKEAIKKQNYGIAMDILCKPYPEYQITASTELKESEDERIRKAIIEIVKKDEERIGVNAHLKKIQWLEKQGETFTKKDVDDAYLKGISDAKSELEKQGEQKPAETEKGTNGNEREIPNSAWSGEDIVAIDCAVEVLSKELPSLAASIERLKFLKPQSTWKPSEEQINNK